MKKFTERTRMALVSRRASSLMLALGLLFAFGGEVLAEGERVYRTGLEARNVWFAVSPDGRQLVFETGKEIRGGIRLMDLHSGSMSAIPLAEDRLLTFPGWSRDGKQLAVVSAVVINNQVSLEGMTIELIAIGSWKRKSYAVGEGYIRPPNFSADGKTLYYAKGELRNGGKTLASNYKLYALDLASGQESQLTFEGYYEMGRGDDDGSSILFNTTSGDKNASGFRVIDALRRYDKATGGVSLVDIGDSRGFFKPHMPIRDREGSLYFVAAQRRLGGGNFLWFLLRSNAEGRQVEVLSELQHSMRFDIARNTGEIFITDIDGVELVIRRLGVKAAY